MRATTGANPGLSEMRLRNRLVGIFLAGVVGLAAGLGATFAGWIDGATALLQHSPAHLWVMTERTPAFDRGRGFSRERLEAVRAVPGVAWSEGLLVTWVDWRRPGGRAMRSELVGVDVSAQGGPWEMRTGDLTSLRRPGAVVLDENFLGALGGGSMGGSVEMTGQRVEIAGISRGARTIAGAPVAFGSIEQVARIAGHERANEITYALVRCEPGSDVLAVQTELRRRLADAEVLTTREFMLRSVGYELRTKGLGVALAVAALLELGSGSAALAAVIVALFQARNTARKGEPSPPRIFRGRAISS